MTQPPLSVWKAILIGQLVVQGPVLAIIAGFTLLGVIGAVVLVALVPDTMVYTVPVVVVFLMLGCAAAWPWWSFMVPRWRRWSVQRGAPAEALHRWAVLTGLEWPKGWLPEKTEFKVD